MSGTMIDLGGGRRRLETGTPWEPRMGYSRAVQAGPTIHVSGCVGLEEDGTYAPTIARQTARCVARIESALAAFDASLGDVVRVRIYTTRIAEWEGIAEVMGPAFAETRPANVLVEVARLVDDAALVEIEAEAYVG